MNLKCTLTQCAKKVLYFWTVQILAVPSYQMTTQRKQFQDCRSNVVHDSNPNCLWAYPNVLDAGIGLFNRFENQLDVTTKDISKHMSLFSTRFKRGHFFPMPENCSTFRLELCECEMASLGHESHFSSHQDFTHSDFKMMICSSSKTTPNDMRTVIQRLKDDYACVLKINSNNNGMVVGIYLNTQLINYTEQLETAEFVFGPKQNSTFPIGHVISDCLLRFKDQLAVEYFRRLDFMSCDVIPTNNSFPEESADEVISNCDMIRDTAVFQNISAEIMCRVSYPSFGISAEGIHGSVSDFQRFWCRIIDRVKDKKSHPQIIMKSAFDVPPKDYKNNYTNLHDALYHEGWWRRRHVTSYEANAFLEKVDELEGGKEVVCCKGECSYCDFLNECCEGMLCWKEVSFQPFEKVREPRVCRNKNTTCAPRHARPAPKKSVQVRSSVLQSSPRKPAVNLNSPKSPEGSFVTSPTLIVLIPTIILLIILSSIGFLIYSRRKVNEVFTTQELKNFFIGSSSSPTNGPLAGQLEANEVIEKLPYNTSMEVCKQAFEIYEDQILGCGAFGIVMKGRLGNEEVAVKTTLSGVGKSYVQSLFLELKILIHLGENENIVNLKGAHTAKLNFGKIYLFLEMCPLGNLLSFLRSHREKFSKCLKIETNEISEESPDSDILTCKDLVKWSVQIASAMEHLASKNVIHADIAVRNVLVFSRDKVKLADFGLSRRLYEYANYAKNNQGPLPWRHMSIEALRDFKVSIQSDVWSFGVTLWEIFSLARVPYPGHSLSHDFVDLLQDGLRLDCPEHANPLVYELMNSCWTADIQARPSVTHVHSKLACFFDEHYNRDLHLCVSIIQ